MMMTREDILRELELLPVWRLRTPLPSQLEMPPIASMQTALEAITIEEAEFVMAQLDVAPIEVPNSVAALPVVKLEEVGLVAVEPKEAELQRFTYMTSEDGRWLFVLSDNVMSADEAHLLHNIFMALRIKTKPTEHTENAANIVDIIKVKPPMIVIAMGEATAQSILQSTEILANLRGTLQQFEGLALVATYDVRHLLQNLPDKAKVWHDLCFAMQALQGLKMPQV